MNFIEMRAYSIVSAVRVFTVAPSYSAAVSRRPSLDKAAGLQAYILTGDDKPIAEDVRQHGAGPPP